MMAALGAMQLPPSATPEDIIVQRGIKHLLLTVDGGKPENLEEWFLKCRSSDMFQKEGSAKVVRI